MNRLRFVQFLHPGVEHVPGADGQRPWNQGEHRRAFLRATGAWIEEAEPVGGELEFWGEWEPQARVVETYPQARRGWPQYVWEPYFLVPAAYDWHQNTDPFVFGDRFMYSNCLQHSRGGPNGMQELARGSLILFGSCLAGKFVVDTVFVVAASVPHEEGTAELELRGQVPEEFFQVVLRPLYQSMRAAGWDAPGGRLYFGATPADPVAGMFSYFPCVPGEAETPGFSRPNVELDGLITQRMARFWKGSDIATLDEMRGLWDGVTEQVLQSSPELRLGVRADMPPEISGDAPSTPSAPQPCVPMPRGRRAC